MRRLVVLLGLLLAGQPAVAAPATISIRDDRGHESRFEGVPARIVTLLPSLTESVCVLGGCARLVGTDRYSNWPAAVIARLPKLGALEDASVEQIVALHPSVVIAATSSRVTDRLDELGVPVIALRTDTLRDTRHVLAVIATLLGTPAAGEAEWRRLEGRIAAATARVPLSLRQSRVYFEVSEAPHAAGAGSFIGELLTRLGLGNIVPADFGPFPQLNPEFVVRAQPDIVIAGDKELAGMAARPGWSGLRALAAGRRCGFPPARFDLLVRPGPRLGEGADLIADCLVGIAATGGH